MSVTVVIVAVAMGLLGALFLAQAIVGLRGGPGRDSKFGIRTTATVGSDEKFAVANRVAAPLFLAATAVLILGIAVGLALASIVGFIAQLAAILVAISVVGLGANAGIRSAAAVADDSCGTGGCGSCSLQGACTPDGSTPHD